MFSLGWGEIFFIAVVALIVVGPKEFPQLLKTVMGLIKHLREIGHEIQAGVNDLIEESEIDDVRKQVQESLDAPNFRHELVSEIEEGDVDRRIKKREFALDNAEKIGGDSVEDKEGVIDE